MLGGFVTILAAADTASAIPAFQRRYGVECHFCHDGYPKLNQNGQRFKERGFRMAQEDPFDVGEWAKTVPLSVRAMGNHTFIEDFDGVTFAFFKGITAGNLGSRVSYWVDDGLFWQDLPDDAADDTDSFTHTKPDNAWGRIELVNGREALPEGRALRARPAVHPGAHAAALPLRHLHRPTPATSTTRSASTRRASSWAARCPATRAGRRPW